VFARNFRAILLISGLLIGSFGSQPVQAFWPFTPSGDMTGELRADKARLQKENDSLKQENAQLRMQIGETGTRNGYLVVATWVATVLAFVLLCVGLASGMKIRQSVTKNEARPEAN
jgi:hypothetical protein